MSGNTEDTSQPSGLFHCPHCDQDCVNARQLFQHVKTIPPNGQPTCLESMGIDLEEFKAGFRSRRRKVAKKKNTMKVR